MAYTQIVKFVMRGGEHFLFKKEVARAILDNPKQLVDVYDEEGDWSCTTINKADISYTKVDKEATREFNQKSSYKNALPEPKYKPASIKTMAEITKQMIKDGTLPPDFKPMEPVIRKPYRDD